MSVQPSIIMPADSKGNGQPACRDHGPIRDSHPEEPPQAKEQQNWRQGKTDEWPQQGGRAGSTAYDEGTGGRMTKWHGRTVLAKTVYDTQRQVSIGTAESNDIVENVTVAEAVQFVRSSKSAERLKSARRLAQEFAAQLEESVEECRKTGRLDLEGSVVYRSRFHRKK